MVRLLGSMDLVWGAIVCGRSVLDAAGLLAQELLFTQDQGHTDESCELSRASSRTCTTLKSVYLPKAG